MHSPATTKDVPVFAKEIGTETAMTDQSFAERCKTRDCTEDDFKNALEGRVVPLVMGNPILQLCIIRGIRYNAGYGSELRDVAPEFARALNARLIMSGTIPTISDPQHFPYCIWHPDLASEDTYRALVRRYPNMRYHVGRACAAAGYTALYHELALLPDLCIAEEARDAGERGLDILNFIMAQSPRYSVMDDYARLVHPRDAPVGFGLNDDAAVRSVLDIKYKYGYRLPRSTSPTMQSTWDDTNMYRIMHDILRSRSYWNITEDCSIGAATTELVENERALMASLLYLPLPRDLPPGNKDLLLFSAAYYGDIDRYSRLRRGVMQAKELACVIRGIYHNTMFAKWWSLLATKPRHTSEHHIERAINARFIMNNDISRITERTSDLDLPYLIWYPDHPSGDVLEELARRKPYMQGQAAHACIALNYEEAFRRIAAKPDSHQLEESRHSSNNFYHSDLIRRADELGIDADDEPPEFVARDFVPYIMSDLKEPRHLQPPERLTLDSVGSYGQGIYDGEQAHMSYVERFICALPPPASTNTIGQEGSHNS